MNSTVALRIVKGALPAVAVLALLEGGARLLRPAAASESAPPDWLAYSAELGWRVRPDFRGTAFDTHREFDHSGLLTVDSRAATAARTRGKRLVLLLGDSRTFGNGVPTAALYSELLKRSGFEVLNLAVPGHSAVQGRIALETYAPRFHPDMVVFAYGFNDRRYVLRPADADGERHFRELARRASWARAASYLALLDLGRLRRGAAAEGSSVRPLDLGTVAPRVAPVEFRRNLELAARYCAEHGIRLVFLLLNDNPVEASDLDVGVRALRRRELETAERALQGAVARENEFSDAARLALAGLYRQTGRAREAAMVQLSPRTFASVSGGYPIDSQTDYRAIAGEVAALAQIRTVDAGSVMDQHPEWYLDFCHFGAEGHRAIAGMLAEAGLAP